MHAAHSNTKNFAKSELTFRTDVWERLELQQPPSEAEAEAKAVASNSFRSTTIFLPILVNCKLNINEYLLFLG